ncbi:MAG: long-chain fatty acid--CoA ligase, partial [Gammaproteobacteria bacterium]|nr:long-chain fatty acid--CoA ligase [Gammaproteobacteria bacterium]
SIHPEAPDALQKQGLDKSILQRVSVRIKDFPGYAQIRKCTITLDAWTVDDGLLTPTMKIKRPKVMEKFAREIEDMYKGH